MVQKDTFVTDDPLGKRTFLCTLNAGQKDVLYLGTLNGAWAYVQLVNEDGIPLRGFAPIGTLFRLTGAQKEAVNLPEGTDVVWTNASEEHHYYDTQDDYFIVPDDATVVKIPDSMTDVKRFENLLWLKQLTDVEVSKDHPAFQSIDGVLYSKDGSMLCFYPPGHPGNELILPEGTKEIDNDSGLGFADKLTSIMLPSTYTGPAPYIPNLVKYTVSEDNPVYQAIDGVLFSKDGLELIAYPMAKPGDTYTVPQGTQSIGDYAFSYVDQIRHVVLPEGLNTIGWLAFEYCESLESAQFPNTLSYIDEGAFIGCTSLTHVELPSSLRTIAHGAFAWSGLKGELRIPEGVVFIDALAIEAISISDLYLPASLTEWELQFDPAEERKRNELNGWRSLVVHAPKGSWAAEYATQQGFLVEIEEP